MASRLLTGRAALAVIGIDTAVRDMVRPARRPVDPPLFTERSAEVRARELARQSPPVRGLVNRFRPRSADENNALGDLAELTARLDSPWDAAAAMFGGGRR